MRVANFFACIAALFFTTNASASLFKTFDLSGFDGDFCFNCSAFDDLKLTLEFADTTDFNSVGFGDVLGYSLESSALNQTGVFHNGENVSAFFSEAGGVVSLTIGDTGVDALLQDTVVPALWIAQTGHSNLYVYASGTAHVERFEDGSHETYTVTETVAETVAEPSIIALMGFGLFGVVVSRRRPGRVA